MTFQEAEEAVCRKLNIDFDQVSAGNNQLFSIDDIGAYVNTGVKRAWDYKPWTFTEGVVSGTLGTPSSAPIAYPATFEDESLFLVIVNGVPWIGTQNGKRNFAEYMKWFSDYPTDTSLIYSEYARFYYLNKNAYSAGQSYSVYGKLRATALVNPTDLLPFSPSSDSEENSGNDAIVLLGYADALNSEKKKNPAEAKNIEAQAFSILDTVWKPMGDRKAAKMAQNQPFFNGQDLFPQRRATRSDTPIGNF